MIDGQKCVLISASFGSMSVNMTTKIIKPVIPDVVLGIRGVGGCSNKRLSGVVYIGQNADSKKLLDKAGNPTPLGKMVATTGLMIKQWGDESKMYVLLLIQSLTGWPLGMLATVDKMAGAAFDLFGPTMVVGPNDITVRSPASSLRASEELLALIADLQARFQVYNKELSDGDIHKDLKKKFDVLCNLEISRTILPAIQELLKTRGNDISELPSLISTLVFCDVLSCRESLVSSKKMLEIITTPFKRSIHGATSSEDDFPDLFLQRDTTNRLMGCIGTFASSLEGHHKQWMYEGAEHELVPTCDFTVYLERRIEFDISDRCMPRTPDSVFDRVKELIELEGGEVFTLLIQRPNFEKKVRVQTEFRRSLRSPSSLYDYDKIIKEALDPMILTVLKKYIMENTTGHTFTGQKISWRNMCLSVVDGHFTRVEPLDIFQDLIGLSQESAREDSIMGHEVVVDGVEHGLSCSVSGSQSDMMNLERDEPRTDFQYIPSSAAEPAAEMDTTLDRPDPNPMSNLVQNRQLRSSASAKSAAASVAAAVTFAKGNAAAASAAVIPKVQKLKAEPSQQQKQQQKERESLNRAQRLQNRSKGLRGGTRKKSKIQKRKITRKYKGKNSRHNHTIKNRHIRNYSLRNKQ
jgi:hypothetical protein